MIRSGRISGIIRFVGLLLEVLLGVEVEELEAGPAHPAHLGLLELKWELLAGAPMADHLVEKMEKNFNFGQAAVGSISLMT